MARGDHIRVPRWGGIYFHHGIDLGDGSVIHYTGEVMSSRDAVIRRDAIEAFLDGGPLLLCDGYQKVFGPDEIVARAEARLGENAYYLLGNNCEHFARWCTTGEAISEQVERAKQTITEIAIEGVSKGTQEVLVTLLTPSQTTSGRIFGANQWNRVGSLLSSEGGTQAFQHVLRENGVSGLSGPLQSSFGLSSVGSAASLLNLGVSIAGFAYLAHQMKQLQNSVAMLESSIKQGFNRMDERFDSVEWRLEELLWLGRGTQSMLHATLEGTQSVQRILFEQSKGRLLAALELSALNPENTRVANDNLRIYKEVRHSKDDLIETIFTKLTPHHISMAGGQFRVWAIAAAAEAQTLMGTQPIAAVEQFYRDAAAKAKRCALLWLRVGLGSKGWGLFGHSLFSEMVSAERLLRVGRLAMGQGVRSAQLFAKQSTDSLYADAFVQGCSQDELQLLVSLFALVDMATEVSNRFEGKAQECQWCHEYGWSMEQWLKIAEEDEGLLILTLRNNKSNRWEAP